MKSIFNIPFKITLLCLAIIMVVGFNSCKKEDGGTGAPIITRVRTVAKTVNNQPLPLDSTVVSGSQFGLYAIIGQNLLSTTHVTFNGVEATINTALNTDNAVMVTISPNTPYANQSNKMVVTTKYGTTAFDFIINPPLPTITAASQLAGNAGDIITLTGTAFENVSAVNFGTVAGQIQNSTPTQITVKVPANALGVIGVVTPGGTGYGPSLSYNGIIAPNLIPFGFSNILYDDQINSAYEFDFNGVTIDKQNTTIIKRGSKSIKLTFTGAYAGYAFGISPGVNLVGKTYIKFSMYGATGTEGKVIKIALNDFDNRSVSVVLHEQKWSTYALPISLFQNANATGTPQSLDYIGFQDVSGKPETVLYLDDIGVF